MSIKGGRPRGVDKLQTIADFAAAKRANGRPCAVCVLAQRAEIEDARAKGVFYPDIVDGLKAIHGVTTTDDRLRTHFRKKHHERH